MYERDIKECYIVAWHTLSCYGFKCKIVRHGDLVDWIGFLFRNSDGVFHRFPHFSVVVLGRKCSDHCPLLLRDQLLNYGHTSFKNFNSWLELKGFTTLSIVLLLIFVDSGWIKFVLFKTKLIFIKLRIRTSHTGVKATSVSHNFYLLQQLKEIDGDIDGGRSSSV
ncbi:hypothetical protein LXL04_031110 [Taraxacum kok-saghyz]